MFTKKLSKGLISLLFLFLLWRLTLFFIAYLGPNIITTWGDRFPYKELHLTSTNYPYYLWSWGNFDGVHYLNIAKSFYSANYTQTFFPLYPLIIRFFAKTILMNQYFLSAFLISNLSFLISLYVFAKLLLLDGYKKNKSAIIFFLLFFPTSFYFGSIYTEGLFFLFVVSSFYLARKQKWLWASLIGLLASSTRLFGILLFFALLSEYLQSQKGKKIKLKPLLFLLLIPCGLLIYMYYLKIAFADPLFFWHAQPVFGAERSGSGIILPPQVIFRYLKMLLAVKIDSLAFINAFFELLSFIFTVVVLLIAHLKKIRLSYLIFSWMSLLLPTLTGTFSSLPRYVLVCFPIFIVLGTIKNKMIKTGLLFISLFMAVFAILLFTRGYWVA